MKYTKTHEWVILEDDEATIGISEHAQSLLGDLVFVELPEVGQTTQQGSEVAVVESVKAASDVYAPLSGTVSEINTALQQEPGLINQEATSAGWMFKLKIENEKQSASELNQLLDAADYQALIQAE